MTPFKDAIAFDDFVKIDLRVATVKSAELHPNADRLIKIQLDDGSAEGRQICAGIRDYYDPDSLVGKQVIIIANLEPRKIRGEISNGMLLAASTPPPAEGADGAGDDDRKVIILTTDQSMPPGSTVS